MSERALELLWRHSWDTTEVALTVTLTRAVAAGELPETSNRLRAAAATALRVLDAS